MSFDRSYRRTTASSSRNRRPLYAPPPAPNSNRSHSVLGYWVPLVVTGTIALGGLAAWIWSERNDHDGDEYPTDYKPGRPPTGAQAGPSGPPSQPQSGPPPQGPGNFNPNAPPMPPPVGGEAASYYGNTSQQRSTQDARNEDNTFYGQVRGMVRRAPSPEQFFSQATRQVSAGMAAAGAALSSIMEENPSRREMDERYRQESREGFSDHERWSEEADEQIRRTGRVESESERRMDVARADKGKGLSKKTIAIVLSADLNMDGKLDEEDMDYMTEHASILSHLPARSSADVSEIFVLIYTPGLESLPPLDYQPPTTTDGRASALGSSYSAIDTPAVTPGEELKTLSPRIDPVKFTSPGSTFDALYREALSLVSHPSRILPFTTITGYVSMLRHLGPQLVYVSDMLAGDQGDNVGQLKGWVGHTVLVAGDDGTGGLADTETEDEGGPEQIKEKWYERSSLVGLGKPVEIVDVSRVGEDWGKRVVGGR